MPLVNSWWLCKKKGKEAWVRPTVVDDENEPGGRRVDFSIEHGAQGAPDHGTMSGRAGGICVNCGSNVPTKQIKAEGVAGRLGVQLMATVAEGNRRRVYLAPAAKDIAAASVSRPPDAPNQEIGFDPRALWTPAYGLTTFADLFSDRQLVALTALSDLVREARERVLGDALAAGMPRGEGMDSNGTGAAAYADSVATFLGLAVSRYADMSNSICTWNQTNENIRALFARQGIPMVWGFAEANIFGKIGFDGPIDSIADALGVDEAGTNPYWVMFVIMAFVFVLGMFLDWVEITFIVMPIIAPIMAGLDFGGLDKEQILLWFAILFAVNLQTSFLTPPFGYALFYIRGVAPAEIGTRIIYRGIVPFVIIQLIALLLCIAFPQLALWLPETVLGK